MKSTVGVAVAGFVLGVVAVPLAMAAFASLGFVVFAVLVALAALRTESRAVAGGLLVAFGLWWVYFVRQAVERCEVIDRQPTGTCSITGTQEQLALAGIVALVGLLLVAIQIRTQRVRA